MRNNSSAPSISLDAICAHQTDAQVIKVFQEAFDRHPERADSTPLLHACVVGSSRIARLLLERGDDPNDGAKRGMPPLVVAGMHDHLNVVRVLLDDPRTDPNAKFPVNEASESRIFPLMFAVRTKETAFFSMLVAHPRVDVNGRFLKTHILHMIVHEGASKCLDLALARQDIEVNAGDEDGDTALMLAAGNQSVQLVRRLLADPRVDANAVNDKGMTALYHATRAQRLDAVLALLAHPGIQADLPTKNGDSPLHQAATLADPSILMALLEQEVDVNRPSTMDMTPLNMAVRFDRPFAVTQLLTTPGIDPNLPDKDSCSEVLGMRDLLRPLLSLIGVSPNTAKELLDDSDLTKHKLVLGETPVALAARLGHERILNILLASPLVKVTHADLEWAQPALRARLEEVLDARK